MQFYVLWKVSRGGGGGANGRGRKDCLTLKFFSNSYNLPPLQLTLYTPPPRSHRKLVGVSLPPPRISVNQLTFYVLNHLSRQLAFHPPQHPRQLTFYTPLTSVNVFSHPHPLMSDNVLTPHPPYARL